MTTLPLTVSAQNLDIPDVPREFRGVWVATVGNIDWPSSRNLGTAEQQLELRGVMDRAVRNRLNAVVLQVRPACDALYASELEPWSYFLTGAEGRAPEPMWDPLEFAVREAHARGLELHAWFNPYRAKKGSYSHGEDHIANRHPDLVFPYGENQEWLDPGDPQVQDHSLRVIQDVVNRYDIDGVHFDDYFYPYQIEGVAFPDEDTYAAYRSGGGDMSRNDWRRQNVNGFIQRVAEMIRQERPSVRFGISPFGIWRPGYPEGITGLDAYDSLYADARLWLQQGWVDYLAPQLYWKIDKQGQEYPLLLDWWIEQNTQNRHIWPGLFTGKVGTDGPLWPVSEIINQVEMTQSRQGASGNIHFSERAFRENWNGISDSLREGPYAVDALVPASTWLDDVAPAAPTVSAELSSGGRIGLTLSGSEGEQPFLYVLYARRGGEWVHNVFAGTRDSYNIPASDSGDIDVIAISAVDRLGNESERQVIDLE